MYETEIVDDIIKAIGEIEGAQVRSYLAFDEPRKDITITVSIDDTQALHFGLDDYKYIGVILITSNIDQDQDGEALKAAYKAVFNKLHPIDDDPEEIAKAFADLDRIVYFHIDRHTAYKGDTDRTLNIALRLEVIGSFN